MTKHDEQPNQKDAELELAAETVEDLEVEETDCADAVRGGPCNKSYGV